MIYEVGKTVERYIGHKEGVYFDMDDAGASLTVFFKSPSQYEIAQFYATSRFEIRMAETRDIVIFTIKIGALNWMDAPYTPHLSKNLTTLQDVPDGMGYSMTILLVDTTTGKVEHSRFLSLGTNFSRAIKKTVEKKLTEPFDKDAYYKKVELLLSAYTTKQLVSMSNVYFKI